MAKHPSTVTEPQSDGNSAPPDAAPPKATVNLSWDGEQRFDAGRLGGPTIRLDGSGASGPSPVDGLLAALGACSAIDVAEILAKRRTPPTTLEVEAVGERVTTIPRRLSHVLLKFRITGEDIDRPNAERAIDLAVNKYCSVRESLRPDVPVDWTLVLNEE